MVNYQNAKIFKLVENRSGLTFIGGTTEKYLCKVICDMRYKLKNYKPKAGKMNYMYEIMKDNNFSIILLDTYPCHSKDELNARIFHHIKKHEEENGI